MSCTRLAQARLAACRRWPAATSAILSLIPIPRPGLGTLAVDKHWRLYYDPEYLASVDDECAIGLILHEVSHLLLKHWARRGDRDPQLYNIAADLAINDRLLAEGHALPPDGCFPKDFQLPGNLSAEQYYRHLEDQRNVERERAAASQAEAGDESTAEDHAAASDAAEGEDDGPDAAAAEQDAAEGAGGSGDQSESGAGEPAADAPELGSSAEHDEPGGGGQPDSAGQPGDGDGDTGGDGADGQASGGCEGGAGQGWGDVKPGQSGSCSDGILRPWEDAPPESDKDDSVAPAIQPHEAEQIIQIVAQATEKAMGKGKGSAWGEWAKNILHPKIDPKQLLIAAIRKAVEKTSGGHDDTSYRRPSRRPQFGGVIRPGRVAIVPRICLIIDSSGSMDQRDLGLALGMVAKVLNGFRLRDGVKVMVGDDGVQSCGQVFDPKKIEVLGRGGTDMAKLIVHAATEVAPKPQLIVLVTDGETGYPESPVGVPTVVCLTKKPTWCPPPPSWIKSIVLT